MTKFEELADMPTQDENAREAPEAEPPQEDGRLPAIYEESDRQRISRRMLWKCGAQNYMAKGIYLRQLR
eukprot:1965272-Pyramimonas_sp.AAC.1